jgi:hypothetical protein
MRRTLPLEQLSEDDKKTLEDPTELQKLSMKDQKLLLQKQKQLEAEHNLFTGLFLSVGFNELLKICASLEKPIMTQNFKAKAINYIDSWEARQRSNQQKYEGLKLVENKKDQQAEEFEKLQSAQRAYEQTKIRMEQARTILTSPPPETSLT